MTTTTRIETQWEDGIHMVDEELDLVNAKIRANLFKTTPRNEGETTLQYLTRITALLNASKKVRNMFGQIVTQEEYKKQHGW
jgi:hypothetical protein